MKTELVESYLRSPELEHWALDLDQAQLLPPEHAADLCVRLASGRYDALAGRFLSLADDIDALLVRAGEIRGQERLVLRPAQ